MTYHLYTLENYGSILRETGFVDFNLVDIHDEYQAMVHEEYKQLQTTFSDILLETFGEERRANFIEAWRSLVVVVDAGDLRPGRFRARKPQESNEGVFK